MADVVIVEAVRTPVGRRNGGLSTVHPADLLGTALTELVARSGIDPAEVEQVVGGCVSQVGEQSFNVARTAWLSAGLPLGTAATTVDTQCGSSQQATNLATSLVASGVVDVAIACGVELMSRVPIGSNSSKRLGLGVPIPKTYFATLRVHVPVRGRRAHRRQVGHHPRRHRRVRPALPAASRPGLGRGPLRHPGGRGRRSRRRRRGQADGHHPPCRPRRGPARHQPRGAWPRSSRWLDPTGSTRRVARPRSATAPPRSS